MGAAVITEYKSAFDGRNINFGRMLRSEWLKLWTLRSTWWVSAMTIALMAGLSLLFALVMDIVFADIRGVGGGGNAFASANIAVLIVVLGFQMARITVAVFGVLAITNEYSSGMIRATLAATPRRLRTLWAKLIVVTVTTVLISVLGLALAWLVTLPVLNSNDMAVDFSNPTHIRAIVGVILYLVAIAWISLGTGALLRHTAGGISTIMGVLLVAPAILGIIVITAPTVEWVATIYRFLPSEAGEQVVMGGLMDGLLTGEGSGGMGMGTAMTDMLAPWTGFGVLMIYAVVMLVAGAIKIKRSDA